MRVFKLGLVILAAMLLILGLAAAATIGMNKLDEIYGPAGLIGGFVGFITILSFAAAAAVLKLTKGAN